LTDSSGGRSSPSRSGIVSVDNMVNFGSPSWPGRAHNRAPRFGQRPSISVLRATWRRGRLAVRRGWCLRPLGGPYKSGINRSRANDGCLPPPDADESGAFRVSDQPRRGGAYHLVRGVLVRSGAEDLQPWCSCLCRPRRRRRLGLALLCRHSRCCGHGLGGDFVGAAVSGHSSSVEPSCCTTGTGSRCPQISGFVQRPATSPTLFAQIMLQGTRMPEIPGARAGRYRCRPGLRSLRLARPQIVASIDELDRGDPVARDRVSGVRG
jgi:hypothetical protein